MTNHKNIKNAKMNQQFIYMIKVTLVVTKTMTKPITLMKNVTKIVIRMII